MKYCVVKDTTVVIDGSDNPLEVMFKNALNAGFTENHIEILTEGEYKTRKALEPVPIPQKTESERISLLEQAANDLVITILTGGM